MNHRQISAGRSLPQVVIFGRTNVGKSTLFNCLVGKRQALVSAIAGTTRDANLGRVSWRGRGFELADTGGIMDLNHLTGRADLSQRVSDQVQRQASRYLKQADLVIFLLDGKTGLLPQDKALARLIEKNVDKARLILVINKIDSPKDRLELTDFYSLGLGEPWAVSAANGSGTGDLLDAIIDKLKPQLQPSADEDLAADHRAGREELRVSIIGQPNVGKSSLLNALIGFERVIVSPEPHTTREPQHTEVIYKDRALKLIDTAGISRRARAAAAPEKFGIGKTLSSLAKSDLALLVLDISQGLTHQDAKLVEAIVNAKKSFIIIANKWDLVKERDSKKFAAYVYAKLPFARYAPIQFVSAKTGEKVEKIYDLILEVAEQRKISLNDAELKDFLDRAVKLHRPARGKGVRHPRLKELKQTGANPPIFQLKIGAREDLHFSYLRFLENRLRENYGFCGTPLTIKIVKNRTAHGLHKD